MIAPPPSSTESVPDTLPAWLTAIRVVSVLAVTVAAAAMALASVASRTVLVLGPVALTAATSSWIAVGASVGAALCHLVVRRDGGARPTEVAVMLGVVLGLVLPLLLVVPMVGFLFALGPALAMEDLLLRPEPVAFLIATVTVGAALLRFTGRRVPEPTAPRSGAAIGRQAAVALGATLMTTGVATLTTLGLVTGMLAVGEEVVVAHHPRGCTAVVHYDPLADVGDAVLFVAESGSPIVRKHMAHSLWRRENYAVESGPEHLSVVFGDGEGRVEEVVPCG